MLKLKYNHLFIFLAIEKETILAHLKKPYFNNYVLCQLCKIKSKICQIKLSEALNDSDSSILLIYKTKNKLTLILGGEHADRIKN